MAALAAPAARATPPRRGPIPLWRLADLAATAVLGLAVVLLALLLLATVAGYRPLIDHSGSMRPAIAAGDIVLTQSVSATGVHRGDIVTFSDRALGGRLVTHRVVGIRRSGQRLEFLTRGDANPAPESWSVGSRSSLGRVVLSVPGLGRTVAWTADPLVRTIFLSAAAAVLGTALLRRIWRG